MLVGQTLVELCLSGYQINRWLSARGAYAGSLQDSAGQRIVSNVFSISLIATYPVRLY